MEVIESQEGKEILNKEDYISMANQYKQQVDVLAEKIKRKKELLRGNSFAGAKDRFRAEKQLASLEEMYDDCLYTMYDLLRMAKSMEG